MASGARHRRRGRGHISSIDRLPSAADEALEWAHAALDARELPQTEILDQFNAMLAEQGLGPITRSSFNRHSVARAVDQREVRASQDFLDRYLDPGAEDRAADTIAAKEMFKYRVIRMGREARPDYKAIAAAALTVTRLQRLAREEAEDARAETDRERAQRDRDETIAAVEVAGREAGLTADRIAAIRKGVLGLAG